MKAKFNHLRDPESIQECIHRTFEQRILREHRRKGLPDVVAVTICRLVDDNNEVVSTGYSFCSKSDQFCKKIGRRIAQTRAEYSVRRKKGKIALYNLSTSGTSSR